MRFAIRRFGNRPDESFARGGPLEGFESFDPTSLRSGARNELLEGAREAGVPHGNIGEVGLLPDNRLAVVTARQEGETFLVEVPVRPFPPKRREALFTVET